MLTQREKLGIQNLLQALTPEQLKSLASTVSKGQVICNSDEDCVKAILAFEENANKFLHRQVISKKIITQYVYDENFPNINECRSKDDFLRLILKQWTEPDTQVSEYSATPSDHSGSPSNSAPINYNFSQVNILVQSNNYNSQTHQISDPSNDDFLFGKTFCNWFFKMLSHSDPISQGFGPSHFMSQAQLFTSFISPGNHTANHHSNNMDISNVFLHLSKTFTFNTNISKEGLKVKSNPHGLKMVFVCGTLLKDSSLCGTFQQCFGLVKDPNATENWKIQVIALKCVEAHGSIIPQFDETIIELEKVTVETLQKILQM